MSQENVEVVRRAFEALERNGMAGLLEFCSPDIEYRVRYDLPDARTYRGHDGVRALAADWQALFEEFRLEPEALIDAGDFVVAVMRISGRGATSGVETGNPYAVLCSVRERRLWRITDYPTREEALEAVGLSEKAMSRENVEVIQRLYEAFNRRDFVRAAQYLHPAGEVYPGVVGLDPPGGGSGDRLLGREELLRFFEDLGETWEKVTVELREVIDAPDGRVLAVEYWHIQGRDGIAVDTRIIDVYSLQDGLIVRVDGFLDRAEALAAVGLSE